MDYAEKIVFSENNVVIPILEKRAVSSFSDFYEPRMWAHMTHIASQDPMISIVQQGPSLGPYPTSPPKKTF